MTYQTVVAELFRRFPNLRAMHDSEWDDLPYVVFGCVLIPTLTSDLRLGDTEEIRSLCSFVEECVESGRHDAMLAELVAVEIGEWLQDDATYEGLKPFLGLETIRVSRRS